MVGINVHCPRCDSALVYRHGKNPRVRNVSAVVNVTVYSN